MPARDGPHRATRPLLGFNLVSWATATNTNSGPWLEALREIEALGVCRITIVCYRFVDARSGAITERSAHGLVAGPTLPVMADVLEHGRARGFDVGLLPFVEIDNTEGIGRVWRGSATFDGDSLSVFFSDYEAYLRELACIARDGHAARLYIGSELRGLTKNQRAASHWNRLIAALRHSLGSKAFCALTYAANWNEFQDVSFWPELDEIGVDAYFPLASREEAKGPARPSEAVLARGWNRTLEALGRFSRRQRKPLTISEWGTVPFDLTSTRPWDWQPTQVPDADEQLRAYRALLRSIRTEKEWLSASDLWHWRMPGNEGSAYGIDGTCDIANDIRRYVAGEE
jgi:hypothetical protein